MVYETNSPSQTKAIACEIAKTATPSQVYCLSGDLGVGKTEFAKGFALGLNITDDITSPTFTIINEYSGRLPLYHFDVYRIKNVQEMEDTGYEDYFYGRGVCLVEWAELILELIPTDASYIKIEKDYSRGEDFRRITVGVNA